MVHIVKDGRFDFAILNSPLMIIVKNTFNRHDVESKSGGLCPNVDELAVVGSCFTPAKMLSL